MFQRFFKYTPTAQEQQFIDIVNKLLDHPKTSLKMTPHTQTHTFVRHLTHRHTPL